jgi:hypothetical protein
MREGANPYVWAIVVDVVTGFATVLETDGSAFVASIGENAEIESAGGMEEIDMHRLFPIFPAFSKEGARLVPATRVVSRA